MNTKRLNTLQSNYPNSTNRFAMNFMNIFVMILLSLLLCIFSSGSVWAKINVPDYVHTNEFKQLNNIYFFDKDATCLPGTQPMGAATPGGPVDSAQAMSTIYNYLLGKGLSPVQAIGIIGNLMKESNLNPTAVNSIGATGIAQWLGSRKTELGTFAANASLPITDLGVQLDFLWQELSTGYKSSTLDPLLASTDLMMATEIFLTKFEKPGNYAVELSDRYARAQQAATELGVDITSSAATTPTAGLGLSASSNSVNCGSSVNGSVTLVGDKAFPLAVSQGQILNPDSFYIDSHENYTAFDIYVSEGNSVVAYISGEVISVKPRGSGDRCGGASISIYNQQNDLTVTYMHLSETTVSVPDQVSAGQQIGITGAASDGCGTAHLHIDAIPGSGRPSCSRLSCDVPDGTFIDIGPDLKSLYDAMGTSLSLN